MEFAITVISLLFFFTIMVIIPQWIQSRLDSEKIKAEQAITIEAIKAGLEQKPVTMVVSAPYGTKQITQLAWVKKDD